MRIDESPSSQPGPQSSGNPPAKKEHNIKCLMSRLQTERGIKRRDEEALRKQIGILLYIYEHGSLSMVLLRSLWKLNEITSKRHAAALKKAGLITWKGSHKRGAYMITEKGKKFVEDADTHYQPPTQIKKDEKPTL